MRIGVQLGVAAALVALIPAARAAEVAALSNGFTVRCDHHALVEGHVRLYLTAGDDNYIELGSDEIKGFQQVPNQAAAPAPSPVQVAASQATSAKLTPADLREMLAEAGHEHNLDVDLLASVVKAESGGNSRAVSRAGARGLMQLMPSTAAGFGVGDSFKPGENVRGGSTYLDALLTRYHDNLAPALAAYNAGPAAVDRYHGIPPYQETRAYVGRVIHEFNRRVLARRNEPVRPAQTAMSGDAGPLQ